MISIIIKFLKKSTNLAFGTVNEENVYNCVGHPSKNDMTNVMNWLLNDDFTTCYKRNLKFKLYIVFKLFKNLPIFKA